MTSDTTTEAPTVGLTPERIQAIQARMHDPAGTEAAALAADVSAMALLGVLAREAHTDRVALFDEVVRLNAEVSRLSGR